MLSPSFKLAKLGVDIIEAGFPIASPDDFAAVRAIALDVGNTIAPDGYVPVICGLSRTKTADLDTAWAAVKGAARPRVHTFIATSRIHMEHKLRMSEDEVVAAAVGAVKHLKALGCEDIEFSPEDAGRSEPAFLYRILGEVIAAGATTLNIPDTTGWNLPHEFGGLIADLHGRDLRGADFFELWSRQDRPRVRMAFSMARSAAMPVVLTASETEATRFMASGEALSLLPVIGTMDIDSTPPATTMSLAPEAMAPAAMASD